MSASADSSFVEPPVPPIVRLFLCGDVMTGRGIDQIMAHPCDAVLHEQYVRSALDYVQLAEEANGAIPRCVEASYIWGAALAELSRAHPDLRIVNLETSVTCSEDYVPKGINYRMSPENADCLAAAAIDCCVLANNHVLDWGRAGLFETLTTLARLRIKTSGAGQNLHEAAAPAILDLAGKGRVLVFSFGSPTSGIPRSWAAGPDRAGINFLRDLSEGRVASIAEQIARVKRPSDVVVVSIHWGPNWGYKVANDQQRFAHALIERAEVSIVHGHSSHHAKAIEAYRDRLILYGCGDFLNDYEGIRGYEEYRDDLALMYLADVDAASGNLVALEIAPFQIRNFRLISGPKRDADWLQQTLDRESRKFNTGVTLNPNGRLVLSWPKHSKTNTSLQNA